MDPMRLVNLTPHEIVIVGQDGAEIRIAPSGTIARVSETVEARGQVIHFETGIPVPLISKTFGEIENLPEQQFRTIYIVSALVSQAAWATGRRDVVCPGDPVRDENGRVIGARSLCVAP